MQFRKGDKCTLLNGVGGEQVATGDVCGLANAWFKNVRISPGYVTVLIANIFKGDMPLPHPFPNHKPPQMKLSQVLRNRALWPIDWLA